MAAKRKPIKKSARTTQALATYRNKRDFSKTAEPAGAEGVRPSKRLRFIVQKHAARQLHYDLRLELDGVFKSWAVTRGPSDDPSDKRLAVEVEDHPLEYGDFEGTIPAGEYGGGTVQLWDRGYWVPEGSKTPEQALAAGDLKFSLEGERLRGSWVLVRMRRDRTGGGRTNWLLIKHRDAAARADHGSALLAANTSVASGRTVEQIAAGRGRAPRPFMLSGRARVSADAVWRSNRAEAAVDSGGTASGRRAAVVPRARRASARVMQGLPSIRRDAGTAVRHIPDFIKPELCRLVDTPPSAEIWVHEVKFDGYRVQLRVVSGAARIRTRTGLDWTERFAALAADAARLPDCLLDGEVVAFGHRRVPSFEALQAALAANDSGSLVLFAFDLLFEGQRDLRALPLRERKAHLEALLTAHPCEHIHYVEHLDSSGAEVLRSACELGLEGVVSKRLDAPYASGRGDAWCKAKCRPGHELVLGGWTQERGALRSLLAGLYKDGELLYVGRVGTGFGRDTVRRLQPQLEALTTAHSPFSGPDAPRKLPNVRWLEPKLVAEVELGGWTGSGMIRQAAFKGLRQDKPAREVTVEQPIHLKTPPRVARAQHGVTRVPVRTVAARKAAIPRASAAPVRRGADPVVLGVTISHPDKPLWPDDGDGRAITKLDLARYFESIGPWMMPHLKGRPCSLVRAPDGLGGQQFFQRHAMAGMSKLFSMVKVKGDRAPYVQIDRLEALAAVAQIGALELHPWNCAPDEPEIAGRLVFDLDPAPDLGFDAVVAAAIEIRERLKALGLESFCKTTGGKGLHVVTPLASSAAQAVEWPDAKNFAHVVCAQMTQDSPKNYLDTMSKSERTGKIFLDYLRNDRTATAVAVLSPRARPLAPVSMPLTWREVKPGLDPRRFNLRSVPALLGRSKAWDGYAEAAASLKAAIRTLTNGMPRIRV